MATRWLPLTDTEQAALQKVDEIYDEYLAAAARMQGATISTEAQQFWATDNYQRLIRAWLALEQQYSEL